MEAALYHSEQVEKQSCPLHKHCRGGTGNCGKYDSGIKNLSKALSLIRNDTDYNITKNLMMSYMLTGKYEEVVQIGNLTLQDKAPEIYILWPMQKINLETKEMPKNLLTNRTDFQTVSIPKLLKVVVKQYTRAHGQYFEQVYSELAALGLN